MHTTAAHDAITKTLDAALEGRSWASRPFRTFDAFAKLVWPNMPEGSTREDHMHLGAILRAARAANGNVSTRVSYAAHLARHAADNPLER